MHVPVPPLPNTSECIRHFRSCTPRSCHPAALSTHSVQITVICIHMLPRPAACWCLPAVCLRWLPLATSCWRAVVMPLFHHAALSPCQHTDHYSKCSKHSLAAAAAVRSACCNAALLLPCCPLLCCPVPCLLCLFTVCLRWPSLATACLRAAQGTTWLKPQLQAVLCSWGSMQDTSAPWPTSSTRQR